MHVNCVNQCSNLDDFLTLSKFYMMPIFYLIKIVPTLWDDTETRNTKFDTADPSQVKETMHISSLKKKKKKKLEILHVKKKHENNKFATCRILFRLNK